MKEIKKGPFYTRVNKVTDKLENIVAYILLLVVVYMMVRMVVQFSSLAMIPDGFIFDDFLETAMDLIIAMEFARMILSRSTSVLIDVLMYATARQAIIDHSTIMENLWAVLAIGMLFAIKKYLLGEKLGKERKSKDSDKKEISLQQEVLHAEEKHLEEVH